MPSAQQKITHNFQKRFLLGVLLLLLVILFIFAQIFLVDLLVAAVLVTAVYPLHKKVKKVFYFSPSLGAFVSMLAIVLVILLPFGSFINFVTQEAVDAYNTVSTQITEVASQQSTGGPSDYLSAFPIGERINNFLEWLPISIDEVMTTFRDSLGQVSGFLLSQTTNIIKQLSIILIHVIVFLMALFYFLRDGDRLVAYVKVLMPISKNHRDELFVKLGNLSYGIIYGIFGAAIAQGTLVGIGFYAAGFQNAAFWGLVAAMFSPVPYIGTMVVWVPAVLILFSGGNFLAGLLLMGWCLGVVGTADNLVKPYLIGASSALNPMALLVVLLGGTFTFGLRGLILGPFILALTLAFIHIYQLEYKAILADPPELKKPKKKKKSPSALVKKVKKMMG